MYTVRVTELQHFCDEADVEHNTILQHGSRRFLSSLPDISRILGVYEPLNKYFVNQPVLQSY
jgi:hypothetical protein